MPIDLLEFFFLTPLPGSEDHATLSKRGVAMDSDLNKYDLNHVTTAHDRMSKTEWESAYRLAWETYYTPEHVETLMRRARASGFSLGKILATTTAFYGSVMIEGVHPLESGYIRYKFRKDRRPGLPLESPFVFYPRYVWELASKTVRSLRLYMRHVPLRRALMADASSVNYTDRALAAHTEDDLEELELFTATSAARSTVAKAKQRRAAGSAQPA